MDESKYMLCFFFLSGTPGGDGVEWGDGVDGDTPDGDGDGANR